MRFWIVQAQENPAAPRSEGTRREWRSNMLAEVLADRGHEAVRWRSSFSHQAKVQLVEGSARVPHDNYHHQFIESPSYRSHIGLARIRNHRALGRNFGAVARGYDAPPDLIHVGNVPIELCHAAVAYGVEAGVPVVIDVRDLWPDIYVDRIPERLAMLRGPALALLNKTAFKLRWAFAHATAITGLTQPYLDWGLEKAGREQREADAIFAMCYPCREASVDPAEMAALRARVGLAPGDVVATYLGNIGYQSDFDTPINAARRIAAERDDFKLVIAGSGPELERLRALAQGAPNVLFPGWLEGPEVHALMSTSAFGMIAYKPVPNFLRNLPNKFSEYLAGGLVVACGLEGEMGRLTREAECGFVYRTGDTEGLAAQFTALLDDPDRRAAMSANARALHRDRFDGAAIYPAFADYLEALAARGRA